jgi:hypothetical protein
MSQDFDTLAVNGEVVEPGQKVKLREHMTAEDIDELVRQKRQEQRDDSGGNG